MPAVECYGVLHFVALAKPNHCTKPNLIDSVQGYLECREWDVVVLRCAAQAKPNHCSKPNHVDSMQGYLECREWDVVVLRCAAQAKPNPVIVWYRKEPPSQ